MVGGSLSAPHQSVLAQDPQFIALQARVTNIAEALEVLVARDAAPIPPADTSEEAVSEGSVEPTNIPQGAP